MSVNIKQNGSLVKISGSSSWTGTRAEYEAIKDTIPVGSVVNITDDEEFKKLLPYYTQDIYETTITPKTNFNIYLSRTGNMVTASVVSNSSIVVTAAITWQDIAIIPNGYKPNGNSAIYSSMYDPNDNTSWTLSLSPDGTLKVFGKKTTNAWAFGQMVWFTSDDYPSD